MQLSSLSRVNFVKINYSIDLPRTPLMDEELHISVSLKDRIISDCIILIVKVSNVFFIVYTVVLMIEPNIGDEAASPNVWLNH